MSALIAAPGRVSLAVAGGTGLGFGHAQMPAMQIVNVHAAKTQLSRLLDAVAAGEEVAIAKAGKPVAKLVPIQGVGPRRQLGTLAREFTVPDDFDDPLPDNILADFEAR